MVFLLLFSYVILCDFFPLYEFQSNKCLSGSEENTYPDPIDDPVSERSPTSFTSTSSSKTNNQTFEYGLQRYNRPAASEILLTIWVFTLFCEEIRQVIITNFDFIFFKEYFAFS
jgi:hypothetical protein